MKIAICGLVLVLLAGLAGCASSLATMRAERIAYVQAHPGLSPGIAAAIVAGYVLNDYSMPAKEIWFVWNHEHDKAARVAYVKAHPQLSPMSAASIVAGVVMMHVTMTDDQTSFLWGHRNAKAARVAYVKAHPNLAPDIARAIVAGKVLDSMTDEEVDFVVNQTNPDDSCYMLFDSIYGSAMQCENGDTDFYDSSGSLLGTAYPHP